LCGFIPAYTGLLIEILSKQAGKTKKDFYAILKNRNPPKAVFLLPKFRLSREIVRKAYTRSQKNPEIKPFGIG
jgi:hypothetical protein